MLVPPEHPCQQPNGITVAGLRRRAQEGFQVLGDDLMEHGVLGVAGPVDRSLDGDPDLNQCFSHDHVFTKCLSSFELTTTS